MSPCLPEPASTRSISCLRVYLNKPLLDQCEVHKQFSHSSLRLRTSELPKILIVCFNQNVRSVLHEPPVLPVLSILPILSVFPVFPVLPVLPVLILLPVLPVLPELPVLSVLSVQHVIPEN